MRLSDIQGADMRIAFFIGICLFGFIAAAQADAARAPDKRVALVIGNNAYKELHALGNPGADAESLAEMLAGRGFDTISCDGKRPGCFDLTREGLSAQSSSSRRNRKTPPSPSCSTRATAWPPPKATCSPPSTPISIASGSSWRAACWWTR